MKYRLLNSEVEVKAKEYKPERFYSLDEPWSDGNNPKVLGVFDTLEEAQEEAKKYEQSARYMSNAVPYYYVTEIYVEGVEWDEEFEEYVPVGECWYVPKKAK